MTTCTIKELRQVIHEAVLDSTIKDIAGKIAAYAWDLQEMSDSTRKRGTMGWLSYLLRSVAQALRTGKPMPTTQGIAPGIANTVQLVAENLTDRKQWGRLREKQRQYLVKMADDLDNMYEVIVSYESPGMSVTSGQPNPYKVNDAKQE